MSREDLVRGKKRQRKKAPKTRSGCATCKIRRIKCGEEKPSCVRCTSTGRKCDGYSNSTCAPFPRKAETGSSFIQSEDCSDGLDTKLHGSTVVSNDRIPPHSPHYPHNYDPILSILVYTFRALPIPSSMGRAFEYFLRRTSVDLAGPCCIKIWGNYILSASTNSLAIQHGIAALSGIHECHGLPKYSSSKTTSESWKHYYLAVKATNTLVATAQNGSKHAVGSKEELLIACAIFITIEVLLGNLETASRHLQGCFSLIQTYFQKAHEGREKTSNGAPSNIPPTHLDSHLAELIGFFARLDLQLLSFLSAALERDRKPASFSQPAIPELCEPLPAVMSSALHNIMKQSLCWTRNYATTFKYASIIPVEQYDTQRTLERHLRDWKTSHFAAQAENGWSHTPSKTKNDTITPESANLLLAHQLTALRVHTALSKSEHIFSTPACLASFEAILKYAAIIIHQRNCTTAQEGYFAQLVSFFSLEMSTVEALYYTAIKCRNPTHRRRAVELLKRAGREGVWDGTIMAKIAAHVISVEKDTRSFSSSPSSSSSPSDDLALSEQPSLLYSSTDMQELSLLPFQSNDCFPYNGDDEDAADLDFFLSFSPQLDDSTSLINSVSFSLNREQNTVQVKCGWYLEGAQTWRYETSVVKLLD